MISDKNRQHEFGAAVATAGLSAVVVAGAAAMLGGSVALMLPMLAIGVAASLILVQLPFTILCIATALFLFPFGLRPEAVQTPYTIMSNAALALALLAWSSRMAIRWQRLRLPAPVVFLSIFILWALLTLAWAPEFVPGRRRIVAYSIGLMLLFLTLQIVRTRATADTLMHVVASIGWLVLACGAIAAVAADYRPGMRLQIGQMNQNEVGIFLLMALPAVIWSAHATTWWPRATRNVLVGVYLAASCALVVLTGSRGSTLSFTFLLGVLCLAKATRLSAVLFVGAMALAFTLRPTALSALLARFEGADSGGLLGDRDLLWSAGLQLFADNLWIGVGSGNGPARLHSYIAAMTSEYVHRAELPSHNPFLEVGGETGLVGLTLYVCALATAMLAFVRAWRAQNRQPEDMLLRLHFPVTAASASAFFLAWIKSGGVENHPALFFFLVFMLLPAQLLYLPAKSASKHTGRAVPAGHRASAAEPGIRYHNGANGTRRHV